MSLNNNEDYKDLGCLQDFIDAAREDCPDDIEYNAVESRLLFKLKPEKKENFIMKIIENAVKGKVRWATLSGCTILLAAMFLTFNPFGDNPGKAYAEIVEQIKSALCVSFDAAWYTGENENPTLIEMAYMEPGIQRISMRLKEAECIKILDTDQKMGIVLLPETKTYMEFDLEEMPSVEKERLHLIEFLNKDLKSLPEEADEILEEKMIEGRKARGFRAGNRKIWIDVQNEELICVEKQIGGKKMVMSNFRFDPEDLGSSKFSIIPPVGYTAVSKTAFKFNPSSAGENDLIYYLKSVAKMKKDQCFPSMINPMEILTLMKEGKLIEKKTSDPDEEQENMQTFVRSCQGAVIFVTKMKSSNDWNYAGENIKLGDSETAIAWYKPEKSKTYRVIFGNLQVKDMTEEKLNSISGK
jgi:hypothetical protein